jgi:hypothetical protein
MSLPDALAGCSLTILVPPNDHISNADGCQGEAHGGLSQLMVVPSRQGDYSEGIGGLPCLSPTLGGRFWDNGYTITEDNYETV